MIVIAKNNIHCDGMQVNKTQFRYICSCFSCNKKDIFCAVVFLQKHLKKSHYNISLSVIFLL